MARTSEALRDARIPLTAEARRSSFFVALVVVDVLAGLADALTGPYLVLFLVDELGLSPLELGAILTVRAICGIAFATLFGAWIDKKIERHAAAHSARRVGARLRAARVHDEFRSLARRSRRADRRRGGGVFAVDRARQEQLRSHRALLPRNRALGVMRASWSLAWAIGPAIGAALAGVSGFRGVFLASSAFAAVALITLTLVKARPEPRRASVGPDPRPANGGATIAIAFAALALFHTAMFLGSIPLAIVITDGLGGAQSDVGWAYSLCAGLEVIVMGALVWRPLRQHERAAIMVGFAAFVAYFAVLVFAQSVALVLWAQILRAIAIGIVSYLGIGFLHSLLPHRPGVAAALFSNAGQVGSVAAALTVGPLASAFGYASIFAVCALLNAVGLCSRLGRAITAVGRENNRCPPGAGGGQISTRPRQRTGRFRLHEVLVPRLWASLKGGEREFGVAARRLGDRALSSPQGGEGSYTPPHTSVATSTNRASFFHLVGFGEVVAVRGRGETALMAQRALLDGNIMGGFLDAALDLVLAFDGGVLRAHQAEHDGRALRA